MAETIPATSSTPQSHYQACPRGTGYTGDDARCRSSTTRDAACQSYFNAHVAAGLYGYMWEYQGSSSSDCYRKNVPLYGSVTNDPFAKIYQEYEFQND